MEWLYRGLAFVNIGLLTLLCMKNKIRSEKSKKDILKIIALLEETISQLNNQICFKEEKKHGHRKNS